MAALAWMLRRTQKLACGWGALLMFPVFMASWLPINVLSFFFRERTWTEIRHGERKMTAARTLPALLAEKSK